MKNQLKDIRSVRNWISRLETEAVLLDAMGFTFHRDVVEGDDGREYSVVEDEIDLAYLKIRMLELCKSFKH